MRFKLSTLALASAALAAAALTSIPAMAATTTTLKVPFSFTIHGKNLPAGDYTVTRNDLGTLVELNSKDFSQHFAWIADAVGTSSDRVAMRFSVDGQNHSLESIQCGRLETPSLSKKAKKGENVAPQVVIGQLGGR